VPELMFWLCGVWLLFKLQKLRLALRSMILVSGNMQNFVIQSILPVILNYWQLAEKSFTGD
uniref:Uncharacterized protein n=1 Tax=Chelonoidis abingdonii TaxID=106734 RepID=A0A8C0QRG4_CHEAB